ncbi:Hypothetical predicted protein [Pelobates cultripes]|uniref:Uncharacterized protein n=1 Tax=Pelobates cultripes TaxID=61616 RepID=A0AAD1SZE2_PELCU|nr:Hypothetical predicted protein [Pelobates cultripes]
MTRTTPGRLVHTTNRHREKAGSSTPLPEETFILYGGAYNLSYYNRTCSDHAPSPSWPSASQTLPSPTNDKLLSPSDAALIGPSKCRASPLLCTEPSARWRLEFELGHRPSGRGSMVGGFGVKEGVVRVTRWRRRRRIPSPQRSVTELPRLVF